MQNSNTEATIPKWLTPLLYAALILALLTIMVSSYIRLVETGLGCDDWPNCFGHYVSNESAQGINVLTEAGKQSPLRAPRVMHRVITSLLGFAILFIFVASFKASMSRILGKRIPYCLMAVTLFLATIGLVHPLQPLPLLTLANLLGGMLLLTLIWSQCLRIKGLQIKNLPIKSQGIKTEPPILIQRYHVLLIRVGLLLVVVQIMLGAWTSANYAGASCNGLMSCGHEELTAETLLDSIRLGKTLAIDNSGKVLLNDSASLIHFAHHFAAVVTCIYFLFLCSFLMGKYERLEGVSKVLLLLFCLQFLLGMASIKAELPLALVLAHNMVGALLLVAITHLNIHATPRVTL